jgi:hypothetical protein
LATYFGKELLNPDQERQWIRSRSMAEALKAASILFLAGAPPYDEGEKAQRLIYETEKLLESVKDLPHLSLSENEKKEKLPSKMLPIESYIEWRVRDQIDNFYRDRIDDYTKKWRKSKTSAWSSAS